MKEPALVVNMDDLAVKRKIVQKIGTLTGLWELNLKPRKLTRNLDQNAFYWAAVVQPFAEWLRENYGDNSITTDQAHSMLKVKILGLKHGELIPESRTLDVGEFADYIEKCSAWMAEFCSIVVLSSELFYETKGQQ